MIVLNLSGAQFSPLKGIFGLEEVQNMVVALQFTYFILFLDQDSKIQKSRMSWLESQS